MFVYRNVPKQIIRSVVGSSLEQRYGSGAGRVVFQIGMPEAVLTRDTMSYNIFKRFNRYCESNA